jgi:hypothetical protein
VGQDNIVRSIIIESLFVLLSNVIRVIKSRSMRHVAQVVDVRIVYKILGRELKERPRCIWEDSIKMSL